MLGNEREREREGEREGEGGFGVRVWGMDPLLELALDESGRNDY